MVLFIESIQLPVGCYLNRNTMAENFAFVEASASDPSTPIKTQTATNWKLCINLPRKHQGASYSLLKQ